MGFEPGVEAIASALRSLAALNTGGLERLTTEMEKFNGFPIRTRMRIESGGNYEHESGGGATEGG